MNLLRTYVQFECMSSGAPADDYFRNPILIISVVWLRVGCGLRWKIWGHSEDSNVSTEERGRGIQGKGDAYARLL